MRILIADDNEYVRRAIISMLMSEDCCVCGEARDGAEALQKSKELLPDLILMDISMPGMSGWQIAGLLRQEVPDARVVIMSQNDHALLTTLAREVGAHACIDKANLGSHLLPLLEKARWH